MKSPTPASRSVLIAGILSLFVLPGCTSQLSPETPTFDGRSPSPWAASLRALDPADASTPANDITAVYLRQDGGDLQIRVDLLDFQSPGQLSLEVRIEDDSAPQATPLNIHIPSENNSARISLDPLLATVIIDVSNSEIPDRPRVDVSTPEDEITGLTPHSPVTTQAVPVLLTLYDTFAARFPAEALRSWDGAHTGPRGERHGLKHLLDAVEQYQIPIVLLDLKKPENLSAMDAMGVLPRIRQMEQEGSLILPDQQEQEILFGFSPSPFMWGGMASRPTFVPSGDPNHIYHPLFSKTTIIPIAAQTDTAQPTQDGPSLEIRRALLETALYTDEKDVLVLGGSLRDSTWGSPDLVNATLAYFTSRPYIHVLTAGDLLKFPTKPGKPELQPAPPDESTNKLETHYQNLTRPVLEFAENWDGDSLSNCDIDIDLDGQPECALANETTLAILDPQGARLTYFFSVARIGSSRKLQQLIGPSWQVAVGLSNPSLWDPSVGEAADPGAYPGAFTDTDDPFKPYKPAIQGNTLVFTSVDGTRVKTFGLSESGLEVEYQIHEPVRTQIPMLVDPRGRFTPGWAGKYMQQNTPGGIIWGLENGPRVSVQVEGVALSMPVPEKVTEGQITLRTFNESLSLLAEPEDPDFEYPPGHYIPFPMAVVEVEVRNGDHLRIERK